MKNEDKMHGNKAVILVYLGLFMLFALCSASYAQTQAAGRMVGGEMRYYPGLNEALAAVIEEKLSSSINNPAEITLLADIILDEPFIIEDKIHIRLVPGNGNGNRTITRGSGNIEFPVIWVQGEDSSLTLGKPDMEYELIIDGGYLSALPIEAHSPIAAVGGPGAKLIMHDKVTLQNNCNSGAPPGNSVYQLGGGVHIRTAGDDLERPAEFIMKGGVIRGNINNVQTDMNSGGGIVMSGFGIFTMEGGAIMGNAANGVGGGFHAGSRASFKKTGGIIYGYNAPSGYRNIARRNNPVDRDANALCVAIPEAPHSQFRSDTVKEKDNLSYAGVPRGTGVFGKGDKWDNNDKLARRELIKKILPFAAAVFLLLLIAAWFVRKALRKAAQKRIDAALASISAGEETAAIAAVESITELTAAEEKVLALLFTDLSLKQIAHTMNISYGTANYHSQNIYRKLDIQSRMELITKFKVK